MEKTEDKTVKGFGPAAVCFYLIMILTVIPSIIFMVIVKDGAQYLKPRDAIIVSVYPVIIIPLLFRIFCSGFLALGEGKLIFTKFNMLPMLVIPMPKKINVDFDKIKSVKVEQSLLQRLFRVGDLVITTYMREHEVLRVKNISSPQQALATIQEHRGRS